MKNIKIKCHAESIRSIFFLSLIITIVFFCSAFLPDFKNQVEKKTDGKQNETNDYLDAYVGVYFCKRSCEVLNTESTKLIIDVDTVTIIIKKDVLDSTLSFTIANNVLQMKLNGKNVYPSKGATTFKGTFFAKDSIHLSSGNNRSKIPNRCNYKGKK